MVLLAACHTTQLLRPAELSVVPGTEPVWVTRADHSTVLVHAPEVNHDTLSGFVAGAYQEMPVSDVVTIRARHRALARTALLVSTIGSATFATLVYFGNRKYVGGNAQTCTTGLPDENVAPCCRVLPNTPCG